MQHPSATEKRSPVALPYYVAGIVSVALGVAIISMLLSFVWWQSLLLATGISLVVWGITFTVLEVRRIADISTPRRTLDETEAYRNRPRAVFVQSPTGDACLHHEDYAESPGMDQGQLTSSLGGSTPLVDRLLHSDQPRTGRV
jgi:hypothetical protein